jgi:hypothetical protein
MLKLSSAIVVLTVASVGASAQILTPEQLAACKPDFDKYCGGKVSASGRVVGCFAGPDSFSEACKKAMEHSGKAGEQEKPATKN